MLIKGTASFEVKNSERNRELENFASLEPQVCEVLLYTEMSPLKGFLERIYDGVSENQQKLGSLRV